MNLPDPTPTGNPRGVATRRAHQCACPGYRPRRLPLPQQAQLIAAAIRRHRAAGSARWLEACEYTANADMQALVQQILSAE